MAHSNSSLNCFASCMAKYEHNYILHTKPNRPISPHLVFGTMAHDVLHKAGLLRDETDEGVVDTEQCYSVIPSEVLYPELKQEFQIKSWQKYFYRVIKETEKYERQLVNELIKEGEMVSIEREIKLQLTPDELALAGYYGVTKPLVGVIDLLILSKNYAIIVDYKFSSSRKSQDDFDMNSQLPIYSFLVSQKYGIPLKNIRYGYIDIPKQDFGEPVLLSNGTLSRAKTQNISQELYAKAVETIHGKDEKYNCEPGGYYYDAWCNFALNKPAYLSIQWLDMDVFYGVIPDLMNAAKMIDMMEEEKMPFLRKYDAHSCKGCEFIEACKPWLTVGGFN